MVYYDPQYNRLVYFKKQANAFFWDNHWQKYDLNYVLKSPPKNRFIVKKTLKYLNPGNKVLDGGCGMGDKVYSLNKAGFDAYGVDIAVSTVEIIQKTWPELKIRAGDVKELPFKDNFFDGYWSLGVIEHLYEGYEEILKEMRRTVRRNGYVFLTFPFMSLLRKFKVRKGKYLSFNKAEENINDFYQFALDPSKVISDFRKYDFKLIEEQKQSGLKGLKDEILFLRPVLQKIYDGHSLFSKGLQKGLNIILSRWTGHIKFMVFQKEEK